MARAFRIAAKDVLIWTRDPSAMGILLGMPLVLILILGSALGGLTSGNAQAAIKVAVVNLDAGASAVAGSDPSGDLVASITESDRIDALFDVEQSSDAGDIRARVGDGKLTAALIIPKGFNASLAAGAPVELEVVEDPGSQTAASIWTSVVRGIATRFSAASIAVSTAVAAVGSVRPDRLGDPSTSASITASAVRQASAEDALSSVTLDDTIGTTAARITALDFYGLSMSAMFLMFGAMFGAFSTVKEKREQTMSRLLSSPAPRAAIVGGKMLGVLLLGVLQFTVLYLFTRFALHVQWGSSPLATFVVAIAEVAAVTGLATLIASFSKSERTAGAIGPLVIQIQALIGGAFFQIQALPEWLQPIRYASVVGWAIDGWSKVQLQGAGVGGVMGPVAALFGFAALFFVVGLVRTGATR